jgi:hypothetical protein
VQNNEVRIVADRLAFVVKCVRRYRNNFSNAYAEEEEGNGSEKMLF